MLEKNLTNWLSKRGFEYFHNFALGGKFPDLITIKDNKITAFEFKMHANEITTAIGQCMFYLNDANKAYIVLPEEENKLLTDSVIKTLRENGIGLILVNRKINVLVEAKNFNKDNFSIIKGLEEKDKLIESRIKEEVDIRGKIIEILKNHPEGINFLDMSKYTNINRATVSKYVLGLVSEGLVKQRTIGTAKLCYLKARK